MRTRLTLFLGIFAVMALSNAIVPVLAAYGEDSFIQGMVYAAYFLGAFVITLPTGILSDRFGRTPFIRLGLAITVTSGLILAVSSVPPVIIAARFIEGIGAGLFVASAMSYVNSGTGHLRMSGWLMAFLNAGLVTGLILTGWLSTCLHMPASGILIFSFMAVIPAVSGFFIAEPDVPASPYRSGTVTRFIREYRWLWYSSIVLIGITGVVTSLYPKYSGASPDLLGYWIAGMSIATIAAVLIFSRTTLSPITAIRWSAVLIGAGILISFFSASGLLLIGALAGVVMIAQMAFLAGIREHQGIIMGLFSTMSYLGMAILPVVAGIFSDRFGFFFTFCFTAICAGTVAVMIDYCPAGIIPGDESVQMPD
jgi:MFS family permease